LDTPTKKPNPDRGGANWQMLKFSSVGIELTVATVIGWGIGYWLDLQLGTYPWLMILFLLLGAAAGIKGVFRAVREAQVVMGDRLPQGVAETRDPKAESKEREGT
jgi:ATP synthase protein I